VPAGVASDPRTPFNLAVIAGSALGPRLPGRPALAGGLALVAAGAALLALSDAAGSYSARLLPAFLLMGVGLGCASVASTATGTAAVGPERRGLASGLLNAAAQIGSVVGLAVLVGVASALGGPAGFQVAVGGAAAVALLAAAGALWALRRPEDARLSG